MIGSLKSPCTTSYRSSIETVALNCLVFEKIAFLQFGARQTGEQIDKPVARSRSRCRERRLNKYQVAHKKLPQLCSAVAKRPGDKTSRGVSLLKVLPPGRFQ